MAGVTDTGFETITYSDLVDEMADNANSTDYFGEEFPTDPSSVFGILAGIISLLLKDNWDLAEAISSMMDRDEASGKYLDRLVAYVGITRNDATYSTGSLLFTGDNGITISSDTEVKDSSGDVVATDEDLTLVATACNKAELSITSNLANTDYTITISGDTYTFTTGTSPTIANTTQQLITLINDADSDDYAAEAYETSGTIVIYSSTVSNALVISMNSSLSVASVSSYVSATAEDSGEIEFYADSLTSLVSSVSGVSSVTNPSDFSVGSAEETDAELRTRVANRENSTGSATVPSIESTISDIDGVTSVLIVENTSMDADDEGRPAKSYEVYVAGGSDSDIAEALWDTKPAGILLYGDTSVVVEDSNGKDQTVSFSRYDTEYAWIRITYSINSEETFPTDGESEMASAVVDYGEDMDAGEDFEPTKFYGPIYSNVDGVYVSSIEIAVTSSSTDTPTYQSTRISVDDYENLSFDTSRVSLVTSS